MLFLSTFFFSHSLLAQPLSEYTSARKYWVFFSDKGTPDADAWREVKTRLTERAQQRRAKRGTLPTAIQYEDLSLHRPYIDEIIRRGGILHRQSRWLNAASFSLTEEQRQFVEHLPFVNALQPVRIYGRDDTFTETDSPVAPTTNDTLDYGPSLAQNTMVNATEVHRLGITGEGVLVGMLDTGFRWRVHEALQNARVLAERDFIQNDDTTANQAGDNPQQDTHGTITMSVIGGYRNGKLIGSAFGVEFLLAKTEDVRSETRIEEDNWMAGVEWMESQGVDIVSSSLGYSMFDDGTGYRWENGDFDGRTAITSRAAIRAARLGVVVCTAMGNEGNGNGSRGTMLAPADADSILAVGAVTFSRTLTGFTSTGPTNDGRIKPEVVAPGASVYSATPGQATYGLFNGTSLATPLTAASAALVLSARPDFTAAQVRDAIRFTADTIAAGDGRITQFPNNFVGWGLVNAMEAIAYPTVRFNGTSTEVRLFIGAPDGIVMDSVFLFYTIDSSPPRVTSLVRIAGPSARTNGVYSTQSLNAPLGSLLRFRVTAVDSTGRTFSIPQDTSRRFALVVGSNSILPPQYSLPTTIALMQNYPNPFNALTVIRVELPRLEHGELTVYNILGQTVRTLHRGYFLPGTTTFLWDGRTDLNVSCGSGVYLYVLRTQRIIEAKKLMLLR